MKTMHFDLYLTFIFIYGLNFSPFYIVCVCVCALSFRQIAVNQFDFLFDVSFSSLWYICSTGLCLVNREYCSKWIFYAFFSGHLFWNALNNIVFFSLALPFLITIASCHRHAASRLHLLNSKKMPERKSNLKIKMTFPNGNEIIYILYKNDLQCNFYRLHFNVLFM